MDADDRDGDRDDNRRSRSRSHSRGHSSEGRRSETKSNSDRHREPTPPAHAHGRNDLDNESELGMAGHDNDQDPLFDNDPSDAPTREPTKRAKGAAALFARPEDSDASRAEVRQQAAAATATRSTQRREAAAQIAAGAAAGVQDKGRASLAESAHLARKKTAAAQDAADEPTSRRHRVASALGGLIKKSKSGLKASPSFDKASPLVAGDGQLSESAVRINDDGPGNDRVGDTDLAMDARFAKLDMANMKEHLMTFEQLLEKYKSNANPKKPLDSKGLSPADVEGRIDVLGANVYAKPARVPLHVKFMECLTNLFNLLLFAAGGMYLVLYAINPTNNFESVGIGCTLITVAFVYAGIEFYEIQKISGILESFKSMIPPQTCVLRDGRRLTVDSTLIVPGDIVYLRSGDRVPADAVLFHATDMRVDGSSLTGETEPLLRLPKLDGCHEGVDALDAPQLLFSTDSVVSGEGYALVVKTGKQSVVGKISQLTRNERPRKSPLSIEIRRFCKSISFLAAVTAVVFFFVALLRGRNFTYAATFGIGILLAWVPQGLPLTATMILAISGRRMAEQKVLVKDLHAVETLGGITMLATDKTGTLTKNEMTVMDVWTNNAMWYAGPGGLKATPKGQRTLRLDGSGIAQMLHVSVTCTRARFERTDVKVNERAIIGDATESGLLRFAGDRLANIDKLPEIYPRVLEIPFTSDTKTHMTIHRKGHANGGLTMHMKGAPEAVWEACTTIWIDNRAQPIDDAARQKFFAALEELARKGSRVIGMAMLQLPGDKYPDNWKFSIEKHNYPTTGLTFLGLVGLEDPPKEEVAEAIMQMRLAGIKVVMITGDNPLTAEAISRKVHLCSHDEVRRVSQASDLPVKPSSGKEGIVVNGRILPRLSDEDWFNILDHDEIIFARTLPSDKLDIVKRAQTLGHIVAVTGDGVNDSAALKKADLGIAMNRTGSDISKESAKMILLDDNFASTVRGIQEGRLIFSNLKKAIRYSLTHILPEVLPYLLYVIVPIPLAMTPTQILAVDLGFEIFMTMSFAWEPAEDMAVLMSMPPRKPVTHDSALGKFNYYQKRKEESTTMSRANLRSIDNMHHVGYGYEDGAMDSTMLLHDLSGQGNTHSGNDIESGLDGGSPSTSAVAGVGAVKAALGLNSDAAKKLQLEMKVLESRLRNRYGQYAQETKDIFTSLEYWKKQYNDWRELTATDPTSERLVDGEVMLYSYLEAGLIQFSGALTAYFAVFWFTFGVSSSDARRGQIPGNLFWKPHSPPLPLADGTLFRGPEQFEALKQVQSVYYLSIFIIQIWNLFACKTRYTLPFRRNVMSNKHTWLAILSGSVLAGLFVYTPITNAVFLTSEGLHPFYLLIPMAFGALLYVYSIARTIVSGQVRVPNLVAWFSAVPTSAPR
ncbi:hypothetical protein BC831DRAFT_100360 [Entophlyctis helioformis]|nr:hypothetical protein BC831DRAFT_100360 [Entophlyctis helioformis]